ncbi:MAG: hypothetical protein AB7G93_08960 [Bdellovibrionales bacterium]
MNGTLRNNIIMNCNDAGIYLNQAKATKIYHNTLYATTGIEVRFTASTADIANNVTTRIAKRDGGTFTSRTNFIGTNTQLQGIFVNPRLGDYHLRSGTLIQSKGSNLRTTVPQDMCGQSRDTIPDLGAIEYISGSTCPRTVLDSYR